jgi:hypothetical protein
MWLLMATCVSLISMPYHLRGLMPATDQSGELNPGIPAAQPAKFKSVRDAKDWANPYLVVHRDAIEVVSKATSSRKLVSLADLQQTLIDLPTSAWPYGRVAAVQVLGLHGPRDEGPLKELTHAVENTLRKLRIRIERWPSS